MNLSERLRSYLYLTTCRFDGETHKDRLESFYNKQADLYDKSRKDICPQRNVFFERVADYPGNVWLDIGGGTGAILDYTPIERLRALDKLIIVDLTPSLLAKAKEKVLQLGITNVELVETDACSMSLGVKADIVSFCYSLTMIPAWWQALECAKAHLNPEGVLAIADFYVSQKQPPTHRARHSWLQREILTTIFATDHVFLNKDHLPYLEDLLIVDELYEGQHSLPGFGLFKRPHYRLIGRVSP